jgi:hypothetical protein
VDLGSAPEHRVLARPATEWSWPPEEPWYPADRSRFTTDEWAPATAVRRPWVRVGRWTVLYRR